MRRRARGFTPAAPTAAATATANVSTPRDLDDLSEGTMRGTALEESCCGSASRINILTEPKLVRVWLAILVAPGSIATSLARRAMDGVFDHMRPGLVWNALGTLAANARCELREVLAVLTIRPKTLPPTCGFADRGMGWSLGDLNP